MCLNPSCARALQWEFRSVILTFASQWSLLQTKTIMLVLRSHPHDNLSDCKWQVTMIMMMMVGVLVVATIYAQTLC